MACSCSSCTNSSYQCQWCYASGICLRQGNACPANKEYSVTPITSPSACPLIWTFLKDKDILVHAGESRQIAVQVRNLESSRTKEVKCHFSYLDSNFSVAGAISSQSLTCSPVRVCYLIVFFIWLLFLHLSFKSYSSIYIICLKDKNHDQSASIDII